MRLAGRRQRRRGAAAARLFDGHGEDAAPESSLVNLIDLMLVFAVGLMLAIVGKTSGVTAPPSTAAQRASDDASPLREPQKMKTTGESQTGSGVRIGSAYRLQSGTIVYVPEDQSNLTEPPSRR